MFRLTKLHNDSRIGNSDVSVSSDMFFMGSHNGTHIDGLNHFGCCGMVYPELDSDEVGSRLSGYSVHGMETVAPIFCRGVLHDTTLLFDGQPLPPARDITKEELMETARLKAVEVRPGDAVLIRTGWQRFWA
jgi:kynurenine formamidase